MNIPVATKIPVYLEIDKKLIKCENLRALVNEANPEQVFSIVSDRYAIFQHTDLIEFAAQIIPEARMIGERITKHGARYYIEYVIPDREFALDANDKIFPMVIASNSYDKSLQVQFELGYYRQICSNGARVKKVLAEVATKHIGQIGARLKQSLEESINRNLPLLIDIFKKSTNITLDKKQAREVVSKILPKKYQKIAISTLESTDYSAWSVYNTLTYVTTHHVESYERKREFDAGAFKFLEEVVENVQEND